MMAGVAVQRSRRVRVLFAAHSSHRGGAEYCLDTLLTHLDSSTFEPIVAFPMDGEMAERIRDLGIEVIIQPMCHWLYFNRDLWYWRNLIGRSWPHVRAMTRLIENRGIDLVYTNTSAIFEAAMAARRAGVKHVWHVHEVLRRGNAMQQVLPLPWIQRIVERFSDVVIFESNAARAAFWPDAPPARAHVVFNSARLEPHGTASQRTAARSALGLQDDVPVVLFLGQFIDRKNPLLLIDAVARLPRDLSLVCLFVGSGPLAGEMEARIAAAGLQARCRLLPFQVDVTPLLAACDVLALPSRQESFGLVLVEAAMAGRPSIACRSEGPCEIILDGETGLLIDQDDASGLATAIEALLTDRDRCRILGEAARNRAQAAFSPEANTRAVETLMLSALESPVGVNS